MERKQVKSSNVKSVGYDEVKRILEVEFIGGDVYQYVNVPPETHVNLITSPSIGKAIHTLLRNKFDAKKVGA